RPPNAAHAPTSPRTRTGACSETRDRSAQARVQSRRDEAEPCPSRLHRLPSTAFACIAAARRGAKKAALVLRHSILVLLCHLLEHGDQAGDLGARYFESRAEPRLTPHLA